jgi:signal transduction histidine kinase
LRHAEPQRVDVTLDAPSGTLVLGVRDDGLGMEPGVDAGTTGLESMRGRAQALGGRLLVESRPRVGTQVRLEVPLRSGGVG